MKIDCLGDICPIPVMRLKENMNHLIQHGTIMIVTDHSCALKSLEEYARSHHLDYHCEEVMRGVYETTFHLIQHKVESKIDIK